jgi:hypothetical protein
MKQFAGLFVAICRTLYCWFFLFWSAITIYAVCSNTLLLIRSHAVEIGDIVSNMSIAAYAVVFCIAWWAIFEDRPASKRWAIAANLVLVFTYVPGLMTGNWRGVLEAEIAWWPVTLIGIFGIIIFSIPFHGWPKKVQIPAK